jgi:hypothetical protein
VIVISPPGWQVHVFGGGSFPVHERAPELTLHLPLELPTTAITLHFGPGTQAKLSIDPMPLWFCTISW